MENNAQNTEDRILEAARTVFHRKGFNGARMQEIATLTNINKALLYYYFRNKELLFERVFNDTFSQLAAKIGDILMPDMPLMSKVEGFGNLYPNFISEHSYVMQFLINALQDRPERLRDIIMKQNINPCLFLEKIKKQLRDEMGIDMDPLHLYVNLLALVIFPVVARPLLQSIFSLSDEKMAMFLEERKTIIPVFFNNAMKGYEKDKSLV
jgi:AcrR family transcriptional regulator